MALWLLTPPTTPSITTATATPSWFLPSTSWPQSWPLLLSLWSSASGPRTSPWSVLLREWVLYGLIAIVMCSFHFSLAFDCVSQILLCYPAEMWVEWQRWLPQALLSTGGHGSICLTPNLWTCKSTGSGTATMAASWGQTTLIVTWREKWTRLSIKFFRALLAVFS